MYHDEEFWDEDYYITNVRDGEPESSIDGNRIYILKITLATSIAQGLYD